MSLTSGSPGEIALEFERALNPMTGVRVRRAEGTQTHRRDAGEAGGGD